MSKSTPFLMRAFNLRKNKEEDVHTSYNAVKTINQEQERTDVGKFFHYSSVTSIGSSSTISLLMRVSSSIPMHLDTLSMKCSVGPVEGYLYESPFVNVASLGTGIRPLNLNRSYSSDTSVQSFYSSPFYDVNSLGTKIGAGAIVEAAGGATKSISGEARNSTTEWILKPGLNYLMLINNLATSQGLIQHEFSFYEVNS